MLAAGGTGLPVSSSSGVYWGCTGQTPPLCPVQLQAGPATGCTLCWGAGCSLPGWSPSPMHRGEHWSLPWERSLTPWLHPTQVPRRMVPAWSSWWTCGTPTSLPQSAKPSTSSLPQDDDGAARCHGFEGSRQAGSHAGSAPQRVQRRTWTPAALEASSQHTASRSSLPGLL